MITNERALWMVVDLDNNELPLFVGDSVNDVANYAGASKNAVMSGISHAKRSGKRCKFVRIQLDEDDDEFKEEFQNTLVGIKKIAEYLGVNRKTFKKYQSQVPFHMIGKRFYADKRELDRWLKETDVPWRTGNKT